MTKQQDFIREAVWQYINTYIGTIDTFDIDGDYARIYLLNGKISRRSVYVPEAIKFYKNKLARAKKRGGKR